jgi:RimJ/RimL family protein N-acetyltransferase
VERPGPAPLTGTIVSLEPLTAPHLPDLEGCCEPDFYAHMPGGPYALGGFAPWFDAIRAGVEAGALVAYAIVHRPTGMAVGTTSLSDISVPDERLEVGGTWIARAHRRTAVNTEVKLLLLGHCFDTLGVGRVTLKTGGGNLVSQRAIERIGATREGVLRRHRRLNDGNWRDSVYYSILAPEWPAIRRRLDATLRER